MPILKGAKDSVRLKVTAVFDETADTREIRVQFVAEYKTLGTAESRKVMAQVQEEELSDDDLMRRYLLSWELTDADNAPVPFSETTLLEVMDIRPYRKALVDGFLQSMLGKKAITVKN